jgi:hypothetical protein
MKVAIPVRIPLNMKMLGEAFDIVEDVREADYSICCKIVPEGVNPRRCILFQSEPPLTGGRRQLYRTFEQFHTVLTFRPKGPSMFPFTDNPAVYPYSPGLKLDRRRDDLTLTKRGVYYAGRKNINMAKVPDCYGSINLYGVRHAVCNRLIAHYPESHVYGNGWPKVSKAVGNTGWRPQKQNDIEECGVDFVLCMENSMLPGYVSEKIHDGFSSDRVTLYLGEPNIERYVPGDCFVNLNPLLDRKTKHFDFPALVKIMQDMTQEQATSMILAARRWRATLEGKFETACKQATQLVIDRIVHS